MGHLVSMHIFGRSHHLWLMFCDEATKIQRHIKTCILFHVVLSNRPLKPLKIAFCLLLILTMDPNIEITLSKLILNQVPNIEHFSILLQHIKPFDILTVFFQDKKKIHTFFLFFILILHEL